MNFGGSFFFLFLPLFLFFFSNLRLFLNYKARFGGRARARFFFSNEKIWRKRRKLKKKYMRLYRREGPPFWIMIVTCRGSGMWGKNVKTFFFLIYIYTHSHTHTHTHTLTHTYIYFIYPSIKGTKWDEGFLLGETEGFLLFSIDPSIVGVGGPVTLERRPRWVQLCFGSVQMGFFSFLFFFLFFVFLLFFLDFLYILHFFLSLLTPGRAYLYLERTKEATLKQLWPSNVFAVPFSG